MSDRSKDEKFGVGNTTAVIPKDMPRFPRVALETPEAPSALPNDTGEETAGSPEAKADRTEKTDQGASRPPKRRRKSAASASQPAARSETTRIVIAIGMSDRLVRYRAHLNARFHLTGRTLNAAVSKPIQDRFREVCAKKRYKAFKFAPPIDGTEKIYITVALPTEVFDDIRARFDPDRILSNAALMRMMFANVIREMEADGTIP